MLVETPRLFLRNFHVTDWLDVHEYAKEPDFSQYDVWGPNSETDTKEFIQRMIDQTRIEPRYHFDLALVDKLSGKVIGGAGVRRESQYSSVADLGYAVHPRFQGRGLATEAARALIHFGFETLGVHIIWATCDTRNEASYRVMERCGMRRVGHLLRHKQIRGHWRDSYRYEILNPRTVAQVP